MARIYTSRQLLDPRYVDMMNRSVDNRLATQRQDRKNVVDSLNRVIYNTALAAGRAADEAEKEQQELEKQKQRRKLVGSPSDPVEAAIADEFVRTGSASGLLQYRSMSETAKAREAEKELQAARNLSANRPKFIELKNKYEQQIATGDFTGAEATKAYMQAMEEQTPGLMQGIDFGKYEEAKAKEAEEKAFTEQEKKTVEMAEAKRQENIASRSADLKQFIMSRLPEGSIKDIDEKNEYMDMIDKYSQTGLLTEEDKKDLQKYVQGVKTAKQQIQEAQTGAIASDVGEQTKKQREATRLAKSVDEAILNNTPPSQLTAEEKAEMAKRKMKWSNKQWVKYE